MSSSGCCQSFFSIGVNSDLFDIQKKYKQLPAIAFSYAFHSDLTVYIEFCSNNVTYDRQIWKLLKEVDCVDY